MKVVSRFSFLVGGLLRYRTATVRETESFSQEQRAATSEQRLQRETRNEKRETGF